MSGSGRRLRLDEQPARNARTHDRRDAAASLAPHWSPTVSTPHSIPRALASLGLALISAAASAGQHSICYQSENSSGKPTGTFACDEDAGGTCTITPLGSPWKLLFMQLPGSLPGRKAVYLFPAGAYSFQARIDFVSAAGQASSRTCTVNLADPATGARGMASPGAELTGYSTDASGLITTGVWKLLSPTSGRSVVQTLQVPGDFVAVGGGVTGADAPYGTFVVESLQADSGIGSYGTKDWRYMRQWVVKTSDVSAAYTQVHRNTGYVIGMRVNGRFNTRRVKGGQGLKDVLVRIGQESWPAAAAAPMNEVTDVVYSYPPASGAIPWMPMAGSVQAVALPSATQNDSLGQFVTENGPAGLGIPWWFCTPSVPCNTGIVGPPYTWRVKSKDHLVSRPGMINTALLALPPQVEIEGRSYNVESKVLAQASAVAAHPSATIGGLKGEFALTGVGATVDWRIYDANGQPGSAAQNNAGNLIWKIEPRPDIGGATVASKDFAVSAPTSITAWALGIKLVPVP